MDNMACLNWEILPIYSLNELIRNLMPATGLKKVGMGAPKGWKSKTHFEKIKLGEYLATNYVNCHLVCNMISYKRDVLERQSLSERWSEVLQSVKECVKRLCNTLKTSFLNVKLQILCKSHHLQRIT